MELAVSLNPYESPEQPRTLVNACGFWGVTLILAGVTLVTGSVLIGQRRVFVSICLGAGGMILLAATILASIIGSMAITGLPVD